MNATWYDDNPVLCSNHDNTGPWTFGTPESQRIRSETLMAGIDRILKADPDVRSAIVIRNNVVVYEGYFGGASKKTSLNIHSASKSILAAATCCAREEGLIKYMDMPICTIIPQYFGLRYAYDDPRKKITIRHLLTMTSGLAWEEDVSEYIIEDRPNWVQQILDLGMRTHRGRHGERRTVQPGEEALYSTGSAHLLSATLQEVTPDTRLYTFNAVLSKIGAEAERWGVDPEGVLMGGCCVYLTARELASFGLLFVNEGKNLKGEEVLPSWAVTKCLQPHVTCEGSDYGWLWWGQRIAGHPCWLAWGWGGQMIYVIPDLNMVFVTTADTQRDGGEVDHQRFVRDYLIPSTQGADDNGNGGRDHHDWRRRRRGRRSW
jgi:CubicO group peptidase (beta-lactamase class C family)